MHFLQSTEKVCPSYRCEEGSELLGVRQINGNIAILPKPLQIDKAFIEKTKNGSPPERRFRFANKCAESQCKQWRGKQCAVAAKILHFMKDLETISDIPSCPIRTNCRWHHQNGDRICRICPAVITDLTKDEIKNFFNLET
jgi:hypothetical protein